MVKVQMGEAAAVLIPTDYSFYVMCALVIVIFLISLKISYRYNKSYQAEYNLHNTQQKPKTPSSKKKY